MKLIRTSRPNYMSAQSTEYIPNVAEKKNFFFNPKREFKDFPLHGDKGERIVRENGKIVSREEVIYDEIYGWLNHNELFKVRQEEPKLAP